VQDAHERDDVVAARKLVCEEVARHETEPRRMPGCPGALGNEVSGAGRLKTSAVTPATSSRIPRESFPSPPPTSSQRGRSLAPKISCRAARKVSTMGGIRPPYSPRSDAPARASSAAHANVAFDGSPGRTAGS
jgi:hypothetical protein